MTADPRPDLAEIDALLNDLTNASDRVFSTRGIARGGACGQTVEAMAKSTMHQISAWDTELLHAAHAALTAAQAEIDTLKRERDEAQAEHLLAAYDAFLSGLPITEAQRATADHVARAASFGAEAYNRGMCGGQSTHAMIRSILVALIDPMHPDLDYLRADPEAARKARAAAPRAEGEAADGPA